MSSDQQEIQQKYAEFQHVTQQLEGLQEQLQFLNQQLQEMSSLSENLNDVGQVKESQEMWVTIGGGLFVPAVAKKNYSEVLMNVGNGILVKKKIEDSQKIIEEQKVGLQSIMDQYQNQFIELHEKMNQLRAFFENQEE